MLLNVYRDGTDQFIEADEPMKVNVGSDPIVKEHKGVVRLLAKVKAREVSAPADKKRR